MVAPVESVAVIGAGEMGAPMAGHFADAGYEVFAFDVDSAARERVSNRGANLTESPGEAAASSDLSVVVVGTSQQVESVLCDEDGVFANASADHLVAVSSTVSPADCVAYAELGRNYGVDVIDVPTCRGGSAAERGELLVLCGGDDTPVERARPVLECVAAEGDIVHLGPVGTGQVGKSANNTLLWACLVADYEVLSLAHTYGIEVDELREVLSRSSGDNWALREWDWLHTKWAHKDMAITMGMAQDQGVAMPLAGLVRQLVHDIDETDLDSLR